MVAALIDIGGSVKLSSGWTVPAPIVRPLRVVSGRGQRPKISSLASSIASVV